MGFIIRLLAVLRHHLPPISCVCVLLVLAGPLAAQGVGRSVVEFQAKGEQLLVEITLNAEALLAGLDPQDVAQGGDGGSTHYARLRRLPSSELEPLLHAHVAEWKSAMKIDANGPVDLSYEGARIPVVGNSSMPRLSRVLLVGTLPSGATELRLTWPAGFGSVVLRQTGVDAPYTGLLAGGETSPAIPLRGGAGMGPREAAETFFRQGVARVWQDEGQLLALALALVFLTLWVRPVLTQFTALALGVLLAQPLGLSRLLGFGDQAYWLAVAGAVVILATWNLIGSRAGALRLGAVFLTGAVLGLGLSHELIRLGVPPLHVVPALLAYSGGVLLAMASVAGLALAIMTVLLPDAPRLRGRISTVASLMLAGLGLYWVVLPVLPL
ncbi:hypothetical protein SAMN05444279_102146 [Ruegeria intermedia]|uniref:HupE / UreJ protein n=1 Tax=Ruegeria intermedia TaxID=996115 RepID=A0A1M4TEZ5_9RHOB|nr:hypothetical protein [Ruegeria intermedia]SHE43050.1 hypothetical protein SAMN05444279_102146 [Ruegeria intermedia]